MSKILQQIQSSNIRNRIVKKTLLAAVAASVLFTTGCSTILTEDVQSVNVATSNGKPAEVMVDGQSFNAPGVITVKKDGEKTKLLTTATEGCTSSTAMNREVEPTFFVNILSGGAFGSSTDYSTDKMWKYQDNVTVNCRD
jgi:hypothetical protein